MPQPGVDTVGRCTRIKNNGERCGNRVVFGLTVCKFHGGGTEAARQKSAKLRVVSQMAKFITPISTEDAEADPYEGFLLDYRRTIAHIRYFDEKIAALKAEKDLVFGVEKIEEIGATDYAGTNTTYATQMNMWLELQWKEREHLQKIAKVYISSGIESKKLALQESVVLRLDSTLTAILQSLGIDPRKPEIRAVVREKLVELMPSNTDI